MEGKKFNSVTKVTTVNSNQSVLLTDQNGNVTRIGMDALKADFAVGQHAWCGRVWDTANATPKAASYIGSLELLKELPYILGLGAYLVKNDHSRRKLDSKDHHKYATGEPARLDGTEGHYQWGWGRKFYVVIKDIGGLHYEQIGIKPIPGEYNLEIPIGSLSAAGFATIERSTGRLVSYINDAANYRGGDNNATYDGKNNTLLGRPATAMTTEQFRAAARKNGKGWLCTTMRHTSIVAILFSVIFNLFLTEGTPVFHIWKLTVTKEGIYLAAFMMVRLIFLIMGSSLMTLTTTPTHLTDGLEKGLGFLKVFHVPVHEIAMMMSIALRFIPILIEETDKIMKAQMARGADFESGNLMKRAKAMIPILVPLFISAFRRANELAMAMEARCYHGSEGRTKMKPLRYGKNDKIAYLVLAGYLIVMIGINTALGGRVI